MPSFIPRVSIERRYCIEFITIEIYASHYLIFVPKNDLPTHQIFEDNPLQKIELIVKHQKSFHSFFSLSIRLSISACIWFRSFFNWYHLRKPNSLKNKEIKPKTITRRNITNFFWISFSNDLTTVDSSIRSHINNPISSFYYVQIVLYNYY